MRRSYEYYINTQFQSPQERQSVRRSGQIWGVVSKYPVRGAWWPQAENPQSKKQRSKALNIHPSQHGLRVNGVNQSNPLSALVSVCLSHTYNISDLLSNKESSYFYTKVLLLFHLSTQL